MNFYEFRVGHVGGGKFAWANGYGPSARDVDDIPFLKDASDAYKRDWMETWAFCRSPPGIEFDPGGREWPDILGCGGGPPHLFVSHRVLTDLSDSGMDFLRATEMPLIPPFRRNSGRCLPRSITSWKRSPDWKCRGRGWESPTTRKIKATSVEDSRSLGHLSSGKSAVPVGRGSIS